MRTQDVGTREEPSALPREDVRASRAAELRKAFGTPNPCVIRSRFSDREFFSRTSRDITRYTEYIFHQGVSLGSEIRSRAVQTIYARSRTVIRDATCN